MSLSPAEQQQILVWSQEGIGLAEQARRLGRPVTNLQATYRRYVRAGLIPKRERAPWRPWSSTERDQLHALIDGGYGYDAIARKLKRSRNAIVVETKRRYHRVTTTPATWSAHDVARLLGLGCSKTVSRWISRGWLKARNAGQEDRPLWRVSLPDLWAFMENDQTWMAWEVERITDAALREWAQELRQGKPRWLSEGDVAARYHVTTAAVAQWIYKGWLPAVRYGNHWIRESELECWVPPCERPKTTWTHPTGDWPRDGWVEVGQCGGVTLRRCSGE